MPFQTCAAAAAQQAAIAASQATQDAAIAALQAAGGASPANVASAVDAMTPAQLAAMCAKLNCQPTAAALTAALLGLSGAGTSGNILSIVGGVPVWQAPVAGVATSVPATGIITGALPAGVTTTPASVVGFDAAALAAVPDSGDTAKGKVALNLGTAAGDATNATDALTAAGLAAILNGTAPNATPNALQAAVNSNPSQYGTFAGAGAPTAAPTAANPATVLTNTNGEVFRYNGTVWGLSENGLSATVTGNFINSTFALTTIYASYVAPRAGRVRVETRANGSFLNNPPSTAIKDLIGIANDSFGFGSASVAPTTDYGVFVVNSRAFSVVAGETITGGMFSAAANNTLSGNGEITVTYVA
jgi:hypothetical protein